MKRTFSIDSINNEIARANTIAKHLDKVLPHINYSEGYEDIYAVWKRNENKVRLLEYVLEAIEEFPSIFKEVEEPIEDLVDPDFWDNIEDVLEYLDEDEG